MKYQWVVCAMMLLPAAVFAQDAGMRSQASPAPGVLLTSEPLTLVGQSLTKCEEQVQRLQREALVRPLPRSPGFPELPEVEFENSLISFRVCRVKKGLTPEQEEARKNSWKCCDPEFYDVEVVKMDAYMRLCREPPVINELGFREVRFTIETWELFGHSNLYNGDLVFSASEGVVQPKSLAFSMNTAVPAKCQGANASKPPCSNEEWKRNRAEVGKNDYPAMIIYNAIYDVWLNDKKIVSQEPGIAMARGVLQIPPTGITVAFQKPIETPEVKICPGTCNGMVTIPRHIYDSGVETSRRLKVGKLRLDKGFVPAAVKRQAAPPP
jgi:hypothetical protein